MGWAARYTPLCPAGHLPHKGGDRQGAPAFQDIDRAPSGFAPPHRRAHARRMRKAMTDAELKLWKEHRAYRLMDLSFRRPVPIAGYVVGFACPTHRLIVEIDGSQHALAPNASYDDGWTVLRFWNDDTLRDIDNVCSQIIRITGKDLP
ncbi:DUF559 domain-containing protein [Rhizobium leguminosarum bv. viciae]|nr:endonuclease domain-containing protein [Rhizobium binae]MBX4993484.1 endonuclease domain-containing protein [Rhizobium binae]NKL46976.1 DUF559 domain-containing protein [Rhizobium leguminosarum bv. viciae]QSY83613.1 endonuclease domain-containing protein [Rhizobium binae]